MQDDQKENQENQANHKAPRIEEFSEKRALLTAAIEGIKAKRNFIFLTLSLAVLGTVLGHILQVTTYTATATLFVQTQADPTAAEYLLNRQVGKLNKAERIETYMRYLNSDAFYLLIAQKLKFREDFNSLSISTAERLTILSYNYWKTKVMEALSLEGAETSVKNEAFSSMEIIFYLKQIIYFETDQSRVLSIHAKALDSQTAQIIANVAAQEFIKVTNERGIQEIEQIKTFVQEKIKETQEHLQATEAELIEFKKKNSIISTDKSLNLVAERYSRISSEMEAARLQLEENQKLIQFFEKGKRDTAKAGVEQATQVFGVKETALILQKKILQLKNEKATILAQQDSNQEFRINAIDDEINKTLKTYSSYAAKMEQEDLFLYMNPQKVQQKINELREESEILKNKISSLETALDDVNLQIEKIPILAQKQLLLENSIQLDSTNYTNLKNKLIELEIQRISQKKEVRLDQMAEAPEPNIKGHLLLKLIFSALTSFFLGICLVIGIEALDPTVKHSSELAEYNIDFMGEIPLMKLFSDRKEDGSHFEDPNKLICAALPESAEAMSFKYIRARIEAFKYKYRKLNVIIGISSSNVSEGKSFISANLAVCLSQLNRKVLLIDADLRRPSQNGYFDVSPEFGLTDLYSMKSNLDEVVVKNLYPGLDYIAAGFCSAKSTEIISSENFKALLLHLTSYYDYIIIDGPPVFAAVDAGVICSYSDIPVLIANFRETKKVHLHEACKKVRQVSTKKVYGIINKAALDTSRFNYYGYHNYARSESRYMSQAESQQEVENSKAFLESITSKTSFSENRTTKAQG